MSDNQHLMRAVLRGRPSIYHSMSQEAAKYEAIDLAQGFPNLDGPKSVREHAAALLVDGYQQYTDPKGIEPLRRALVADAKERFGVELDSDEQVVVTAGAQDALGAALLGLLEAGDEVVIIEPFYNPTVPLAQMAGATLRFVSLQGADFHLDEDLLMAAMSERTKLIVYNTPNNPSGHVFTRDELEIMARACHRYDAYLLADEVYEHLVFDTNTHISALEVPELAERALVISSFSKTYLMTGWRVGWALGAAPLVAAVNRVHQLMSFCLPHFLSEGARFAVEELPKDYYRDFVAVHQQKRDLLCKGLESCGMVVHKPQGTIFCAIDIRSLGEEDDIEFCLRMPKEVGVAAVPMSVSWHKRQGARHLVRLCFSKTDETLEKAVDAFTVWSRSQR